MLVHYYRAEPLRMQDLELLNGTSWRRVLRLSEGVQK
jgi:hypothetical protein